MYQTITTRRVALHHCRHMPYNIPFPCAYCQGLCHQKGKRGTVQLVRCATCGKYQRTQYRNKACTPGMDSRIVGLTREGCGIRGTARILCISPTTVIARIKRIASRLGPGTIHRGRSYEVDELCTYVGNKKNWGWLASALDRTTKRVVAFRIGKRSKRMLRPLVDSLVLADARYIRTDGCDVYRTLVPGKLHHVKRFGTNGIERFNLHLRTCLKQLGRTTLCYSKCATMLAACVAVVCWGDAASVVQLSFVSGSSTPAAYPTTRLQC